MIILSSIFIDNQDSAMKVISNASSNFKRPIKNYLKKGRYPSVCITFFPNTRINTVKKKHVILKQITKVKFGIYSFSFTQNKPMLLKPSLSEHTVD